jgi:hypothetical protein
MRIGPVCTIALAAFATESLASDVRLLKFPDSVIGTWAPNADACAGSAKATINISAKQHSSADLSCQVVWITVTASRDGPVYSARSNCAKAKGEKAEPPSYFVVSPRADGKLSVRLPTASSDADMATYQKCL